MLFYLITTLLLLAFVRHNHRKSALLHSKYELYKIRDELRREVIACNISQHSRAFEILDQAISRNIANLHRYSLLTLFFKSYQLSKSPDLKDKTAELIKKEIKSNPVALKYYTQHNNIIGSWIIHQHFLANHLVKAIRGASLLPAYVKSIGRKIFKTMKIESYGWIPSQNGLLTN